MEKMIEELIERISTKHDDAIANENVYNTIESEAKSIFGERFKKLKQFKDDHVDLFATDKPIKDLLHLFFNSGSGICKLDASEQEEMESAFTEWVDKVSWKITE